ncbi:VanZ family protein [Rhodocyclus tenuis]|uniref:VanZ-like domain-containing protein n=2 Tax=Rhodocyclus TaxID=1064 RepID=A0A6L5JUI4_RHOTE|nr:VanZ family protein [Rhodocyclus gracilis]MQY51017.1 hypothetical protein [Rhodocyclus gracilis]NJA88727.1 VanZ family protein [Rhodocyclus gracilis]
MPIEFLRRQLAGEVAGVSAFALACLLGAGLLVTGLFGLGATPVAVGLFVPPWDKLAHATTFACLTGLLACGFGGRRLAMAGALAFAVGALDETLQRYHPGRQSDLADLAADLVGVLLAVVLLRLLQRSARRRH